MHSPAGERRLTKNKTLPQARQTHEGMLFINIGRIRRQMMDREKVLAEIILNNSPFAWWEWDVINNKVFFNDLKVTMLGYKVDAFKEKGYEVFTDLLHPSDHENAMNAMRDLLAGRNNIYQVDYRIKDNNGEYHWYMDRGAVIAMSGDKISRIRGIVIDLGSQVKSGSNVEMLVLQLRHYSEDQNKFIIICSACKRIKISNNEWAPLSDDLSFAITDALSHGICPSCVRKLYPDYADKILGLLDK
jgi:PAS domain S-box-containing protein